MKRKTYKLPKERRIRATIIELDFHGISGNGVYLNNVDPNDTDEAIKVALENRFPGKVHLRNENVEYASDLERITESYLIGHQVSKLTLMLRTFSTDAVYDYMIDIDIHWGNAPDNLILPDLVAYYDCRDYDCDTIARQVTEVYTLAEGEHPIVVHNGAAAVSE